MQEVTMKVLLVSREDYSEILRTVWGLRHSREEVDSADLVVDTDTNKILKSRYF